MLAKIHKIGTTNFFLISQKSKKIETKTFIHNIVIIDFENLFLILFFRGNSLKRTVPKPTIKVSVPRPDSLSLELYDDDNKKDEENIEIIKKVPSAVLPDEITEELDALSRDDFMPSQF